MTISIEECFKRCGLMHPDDFKEQVRLKALFSSDLKKSYNEVIERNHQTGKTTEIIINAYKNLLDGKSTGIIVNKYCSMSLSSHTRTFYKYKRYFPELDFSGQSSFSDKFKDKNSGKIVAFSAHHLFDMRYSSFHSKKIAGIIFDVEYYDD